MLELSDAERVRGIIAHFEDSPRRTTPLSARSNSRPWSPSGATATRYDAALITRSGAERAALTPYTSSPLRAARCRIAWLDAEGERRSRSSGRRDQGQACW